MLFFVHAIQPAENENYNFLKGVDAKLRKYFDQKI